MIFNYDNNALVSVQTSHPKLARLTSTEMLLCYGPSSNATIGVETANAEDAHAAGEPSQSYVDAAVNAMVTAGFITSQRGLEIKA